MGSREQVLLEKVFSNDTPNKRRFDEARLDTIEYALAEMKKLNEKMLRQYEATPEWNKIVQGLVKHNVQVSLQNLVEFKLCQPNKPESTYFNPFAKKPITMCYNKFGESEPFNQALTYNMVLLYDARTHRKMDWNELQPVTLANVRAINLSRICKKQGILNKFTHDETRCMREELKQRVFEKERFKDRQLSNIDEVIEKGLRDTTPITQAIFRFQ